MRESDSSLISVVILNWNGGRLVEECLMSLQTQSYRPLEMIVVDNASTDGSADLIKMRFPDVKLIVNDRNLGFGGGNNLGIHVSQGRYIMILNNDARLDPPCIEELKKSIDKDKRYGASASKILLDGVENLLDAAGISIFKDGLSIGRGRLESGDRYPIEEEVFSQAGVRVFFERRCWMISVFLMRISLHMQMIPISGGEPDWLDGDASITRRRLFIILTQPVRALTLL